MPASQAMNAIFERIGSLGLDMEHLDDEGLERIKQTLHEENEILWINDHQTLKPVFVNDRGRAYYGFESCELLDVGFELYNQFLDPDHFDDVHTTISFFANNPSDVHRMTYRVKRAEGDWRWTYSLGKAINYSANGHPKYVLSIVYDVEELVNQVFRSKVLSREEQRSLKAFQSLTKREKEILRLIAAEYTSHEIGEKLFIEASTVDTHRKNIIKKLGVKSSIGIVKFSILFQ